MKIFAEKILTIFGLANINPISNPSASEFEVNNWVLSDFVLKKLVPLVGVHPYPLNELVLMVGAVCRFRPSHVFEWGTNVGTSARIFYETSRYFKIPLEIHSIDLPGEESHVEHPGHQRGKFVRGKSGVSLHLGDGIEISLGIYRTLPASSSVLFFVDGDHSYESVKRELEAIVSEVATPRVLLHDTFYQSLDSGYNVGPHRAMLEVLEAQKKAGRHLRSIETKTGLPGMTLIY